MAEIGCQAEIYPPLALGGCLDILAIGVVDSAHISWSCM